MICKYCRTEFEPRREDYPHCDSMLCALQHTHRITEIEWMEATSKVEFKRELDTLNESLEFDEMVKRGTKAWADVPNAAEFIDRLRGGDDE